MSRLYSKLYKEAEKIKKWKVSVESELKQKENKLQENRKIIEAQRKAIQELQVSLLLIQSAEKEDKMKDLTFLLEESREKINQLEEKTKLQNESLKESIEKKDLLTSELEDIKMSLQISVSTQKASEEDLQIATKTIYQLTEEKEAQMEEFNKAKAAHSVVLTELKTSICNLEELLRKEQQSELESVKEELKQKGDEVKCKLDKSEENCNNLRKQVENKSKHIEELQQEINKLELELESTKQKFEEMSDNYQKEIEDKKISEENLMGEVEKAKVIADEAVKLQKEIDIRCQHKIAEMVALMEKHKHQYDKIVEERDSELGLYKSKEQEQSSMKASLELELANLKNELLSIEKQLEIEKEEKKTQASLLETPETNYRKFDSKTASSQNISRNFSSADHGKSKDKRDYLWTSAKSTLSAPLPRVGF
ncbi:Synaptonemal complex protein 1 [Sciurus carolinensis]|uniref:Synaptonemal complex protein 1 n=1 Tax=Sciurus carolinensis TaxID=30640 RepID=A0AA41N710_SCICA|nr:Synaptonemal complex protein 1 [Sciurus carolinensis]